MTDNEILAQAIKADLVYDADHGAYYGPFVEETNIKDQVLAFGKAMFAAGAASVSKDIQLTNEDAVMIVDLMDNPPPPNPALQAAFDRRNVQGEQEPVIWYAPEQMRRTVLHENAEMLEITGANVRWGNFTTPLYSAPVPQSEQEPCGYKLMPIEPTREHLEAIRCVIEKHYNDANHAQMYKEKHAYSALLSVAQPKDAQ